jgi:hypothetical protein
MAIPPPDDDDAMREALQQDAARVSMPPFDPALHYATMRLIRGLPDPRQTRRRWRPVAALAAAACGLALFLALWRLPSPSGKSPHETPRAAAGDSWAAYEKAATNGDAALLAMLDHQAQTLLPATAPIFNTTFP